MNMYKLYVVVDTGETQIFHVDQNHEAHSRTFTPSGVELYEAVIEYLKTDHQLWVSRLSAAMAIHTIGSAVPTEKNMTIKLIGRDLNNGLPGQREISTIQINTAIAPTLDQIVMQVTRHIHDIAIVLPPDTTLENEIILSGDYSMLRDLAERIEAAIRAEAMPEAMVVVKSMIDLLLSS
jgi:rod shape-determining protein MreB